MIWRSDLRPSVKGDQKLEFEGRNKTLVTEREKKSEKGKVLRCVFGEPVE